MVGASNKKTERDQQEASIGDRIIVELKNFDGWLIRQVDENASTKDPALSGISTELQRVIQDGYFLNAILAYKDLQNECGQRGAGCLEKVADDWLADRPKPSPGSGAQDSNPRQPFREKRQALLQLLQLLRPDRPDDKLKVLREALETSRTLIDGKIKTLVLKVDGYVLTDLHPVDLEVISSNPTIPRLDDRLVTFELKQNDVKRDVWDALRREMFLETPVRLTLITKVDDREIELPTAVTPQGPSPLTLEMVRDWRFKIAIVVVLLSILLFLYLAFQTDLIRDPDRPRRADGNQPFSLSRTQMAFWFLLVASSYVFLYS